MYNISLLKIVFPDIPKLFESRPAFVKAGPVNTVYMCVYVCASMVKGVILSDKLIYWRTRDKRG